MRGIMIQGTASDVGKSLLTTALCRLLVNDGYHVAPFKSQNMSNNTYITKDGKEISKAQALQAEAAKVEPSVWMSPIVLIPKTEVEAEVIMLGESREISSGKAYRENFYEQGIIVIKQSLDILDEQYEIVVMEGAGSPVEVNLKDKELVNMKVAELADVPVILVADIDRGGVFASIVGTLALLTESEKKRVKGIVINKFRGDQSMFSDGIKWIETKVGIPVLGVIPYLKHSIEAEDSLSEQNSDKHEDPTETNQNVDIYDELANQMRNHFDYEKIKNIINTNIT